MDSSKARSRGGAAGYNSAVDSQRKILWISGAVIVAVVAVVMIWPRVSEQFAPRPVKAWVAIQEQGSPIARTGRLEIPAGHGFTLHAVLEAQTHDGGQLFYTEAKRLEIEGKEVPAAEIREWDQPLQARILWFTVEGAPTYLPIEGEKALAKFHFEDNYRADWARAWTVPGSLEPSFHANLPPESAGPILTFGTQRFAVRIELYSNPSSIAPQLRVSSPGAAAMPNDPGSVATVVAPLPAPLARISRVFGLSELAITPTTPSAALTRIRSLQEADQAFSPRLLLRDYAGADEGGLDGLHWRDINLASGPKWGPDGAQQGDLIRVGSRVVVLERDRGAPGRLDSQDLCFDFYRRPEVLPLSRIFVGGGLVQWAKVRKQ